MIFFRPKMATVQSLQALIPNEWQECLRDTLAEPYWNDIVKELNSTKKYCPEFKNIFKALSIAPDKVRLVILGQDPYPTPGWADGYSFSVPTGTIIPPPLRNLYKELQRTYGWNKLPEHGNLEKWVNEGVLLLNIILTVKSGEKALSHEKIGWQNFTNAVIRYLDLNQDCVFVAFGKKAQEACAKQVHSCKLFIAGHPNPMNTYTQFIGCGIFKEIDDYLEEQHKLPIRWHAII